MMAGPCMITFAIPLMVPGITLSLVAFDDETGFAKFSALHIVGFIFCAFSVTLLVVGCVLRVVWKSKITPDLEQHLTPRNSMRRLNDRSRTRSDVASAAAHRIYTGTRSTDLGEDSGQSSSNTLIGNGIVNKAFDVSSSSSGSLGPSSSSEEQSSPPSSPSKSSECCSPDIKDHVTSQFAAVSLHAEDNAVLYDGKNNEVLHHGNKNDVSSVSEPVYDDESSAFNGNRIISVKSVDDFKKSEYSERTEDTHSQKDSIGERLWTGDPPPYGSVVNDNTRKDAFLSREATVGVTFPCVENPHDADDCCSLDEDRTMVSIAKVNRDERRQSMEVIDSTNSIPTGDAPPSDWAVRDRAEEIAIDVSLDSESPHPVPPDCPNETTVDKSRLQEPLVLEEIDEDFKFQINAEDDEQVDSDTYSTTSDIHDSIFSTDSVLAQYT
ncbi:hypothetical protein ScPMuIL_004219 [Solemya velum]